ncbi:MAG: hypothetical protein AAFX56_09205 [Pseudomonadota bacterium]
MRTVICSLLLILSSPVFADDLNYNFFQLSFDRVELDDDFGLDVDGDSWAFAGSFEVAESWFVFADYGMGDFDFGVDLDQWSVGGGFHTPVANNVDFVATAAYVGADISAGGLSVDDNGLGASIGLRAMVTPNVELNGTISYVDLGDFGDDTSLSGSAWWNFTEQFALGVRAGVADDVTQYGIGGRFYFGR